MADASQLNFDKRMRRISKRHQKLSRGYVTSINHDGLVIARPRRKGFSFPFRGLFLALLLFIAFKGFVLASIGATAYDIRVSKLEAGTVVEQAGAYVMKADPATTFIANKLNSVLPALF